MYEFENQLNDHQLWLEDNSKGSQMCVYDEFVSAIELDPSLDYTDIIVTNCVISAMYGTGIDLSKAQFRRSYFDACEFNECNFSKADFDETYIVDTTFEKCNLTEACLVSSFWNGSKIIDCTMTNAQLGLANFACGVIRSDLTDIKDLDGCIGDGTYIYNILGLRNFTYTDKLIGSVNTTIPIEEFLNLDSQGVLKHFGPAMLDVWDDVFPVIKVALNNFPAKKWEGVPS